MTPAEFQSWFALGQFQTFTDDVVQTYLNRASAYVDSTWGIQQAEGMANCAAHLIVVDQAEAAQPVDQIDGDDATMDSIGPIQSRRSEKVVEMMAKDPWLRTTYGRRFSLLRDLVGLGGSA